MRRRKRLRELLDWVELTDDRRKRVRQASGGMQRRLALAAAFVHDPAVAFLDEPTAGIDPILRARFWDQFRVLRDAGRTLIVTTQYVGEAAATATSSACCRPASSCSSAHRPICSAQPGVTDPTSTPRSCT